MVAVEADFARLPVQPAQQLLEQLGAPAYGVSWSYELVAVNRYAQRLTGRSTRELLGARPDLIVRSVNERERLTAMFAQIRRERPAPFVISGLLSTPRAEVLAASRWGYVNQHQWGFDGIVGVWQPICLQDICRMLDAPAQESAFALASEPRAARAAGAPQPDPAPASEPRGGRDASPPLARLSSLSARERQIAARLLGGVSVVDICDELGIAENTLRNHCRHVYAKLDVCSREELLRHCVQLVIDSQRLFDAAYVEADP